MQQSSNHKAPTLSLEEGNWSPFSQILYSTRDLPSSQANVNQTARPLNPEKLSRENSQQPRQDAYPNGNANLEVDYWQGVFSNDEPVPLNHYPDDHQNDGIPEESIFRESSFVDDDLEEVDFEISTPSFGTAGDHDFEDNDFDSDQVIDRYIEQELEQYRPRSSRAVKQREFNVSLDDLFEYDDNNWEGRSNSNGTQRKRLQGDANGETYSKCSVKRQLEQGLIRALEATNASDYLNLLTSVFSHSLRAFSEVSGPSAGALQAQLTTLKLLAKRYGDQGFNEQAMLEDTVEIYLQTASTDLLPVVTGLVVRVLLKPQLKQGRLNPSLLKRMFSIVGESVKMLASRHQLKALPGLMTRVRQLCRKRQLPIHKLPQLLHQLTTQVTQNPQLYQKLCHIGLDKTVVQEENDTSQRLRINGPVEIFIKRLDNLSGT